MKPLYTEIFSGPKRDKQLQGIALESVLEKRRLDQALNAKEFAVLAGVSYSTARGWFRLPGFPCFRGVVFWQDFAAWRTGQNGVKAATANSRSSAEVASAHHLPARAARILLDGR
jgi:hypothetical protein